MVACTLAVACATAPPRPTRSEFEDIPVPKGLVYQPEKSTIIESPKVKAALLLYRGRVEVDSLTVAMRATLEANGWKHLSTTVAPKQKTTQVYEKEGSSLQARFWDGLWFTYAELTVSRILQPPK